MSAWEKERDAFRQQRFEDQMKFVKSNQYCEHQNNPEEQKVHCREFHVDCGKCPFKV